jgi:hypothetical protein
MLRLKQTEMKKLTILIALSIALFSACKQVDEYTHFNVDHTETMDLPYPIMVDSLIVIETGKKDLASESTLALYSTERDRVEEVICSNITLQMVTPDDVDFSFLKSVEVYIYGPNTPEVRVAYKETIPDDVGTELRLETPEINLYKFLQDDFFRLRIEVIADEQIDSEYIIDAYSFYNIDAKILGQ